MTDFDRDQIILVIARLAWRFAKTMPDQPHEYTVRSAENEAAYVALFEAIKAGGHWEKWGKYRYRYLYPGDGWRYWIMGGRFAHILNRARVDGDHELVLERARAAGRLA